MSDSVDMNVLIDLMVQQNEVLQQVTIYRASDGQTNTISVWGSGHIRGLNSTRILCRQVAFKLARFGYRLMRTRGADQSWVNLGPFVLLNAAHNLAEEVVVAAFVSKSGGVDPRAEDPRRYGYFDGWIEQAAQAPPTIDLDGASLTMFYGYEDWLGDVGEGQPRSKLRWFMPEELAESIGWPYFDTFCDVPVTVVKSMRDYPPPDPLPQGWRGVLLGWWRRVVAWWNRWRKKPHLYCVMLCNPKELLMRLGVGSVELGRECAETSCLMDSFTINAGVAIANPERVGLLLNVGVTE